MHIAGRFRLLARRHKMLDETKYRSPYYGLWVACLIMVVVSLAAYGLIYAVMVKYQTDHPELNEPSARALGFCVGAVFDLMCFACGAFKQHSDAVIKRIFAFFGNLKVGLGFALHCYLEDIKSDGVVLVIVLSLTAFTGLVAYTGLRDFFALWRG